MRVLVKDLVAIEKYGLNIYPLSLVPETIDPDKGAEFEWTLNICLPYEES
jgi:hypothetical protein